MAVGVGQIAFGGGSHVSEDKRGCCFGSDAGEIDAVPGRDGRRENAGFRTKRRRRVVANTESISVMWTASVLFKQFVSRGLRWKGFGNGES